MSKQIKIDKDFVDSIKRFEKIHKKYIEEDGSLNDEGWDYLHDAEVNWGDDIKWNDHIKFHMQPRVNEYWYGDTKNEERDIEYKRHWIALHPKKAKEFDIEVDD